MDGYESNLLEDHQDHKIELLKKCLIDAEEQAMLKDQQISQLTSRLREYEMGEYGLAQAVCEIKDCKRIIRVREREIEMLTKESNFAKFQVSELLERQNQCSPLPNEPSVSVPSQDFLNGQVPQKGSGTIQKLQKRKGVVLTTVKEKSDASVSVNDDKIRTYLQNEKLRSELTDVCEKAMQCAAQIQSHARGDASETRESILQTEENFKKMHQTLKSLTERKKTSVNVFPNFRIDSENEQFIKFAMDLIEKEDDGVQKIFHQLMNEIKILKRNQSILTRRYITLYDNNSDLRKENQKLKKRTFLNDQTASGDIKLNYETFDDNRARNQNEFFIQEIKSLEEGHVCTEMACSVRQNKLHKIVEWGTKLAKNIVLLKQLLEVSKHQTVTLEAICFSQEVQIDALNELILFFQTQSDERMLLGKLIRKVLQLQFTQASYANELKKCRVYKKSSEKLLKELLILKDNEINFSVQYLEAREKGRKLGEVLKDLRSRCNTAVEALLDESDVLEKSKIGT